MIDKEKIPNNLYQEMLYLFGKEKTEQIAKNVGYSYHGLIWKVTDEKFRRKFGIRIFTFVIAIVIILIIIGIYSQTNY